MSDQKVSRFRNILYISFITAFLHISFQAYADFQTMDFETNQFKDRTSETYDPLTENESLKTFQLVPRPPSADRKQSPALVRKSPPNNAPVYQVLASDSVRPPESNQLSAWKAEFYKESYEFHLFCTTWIFWISLGAFVAVIALGLFKFARGDSSLPIVEFSMREGVVKIRGLSAVLIVSALLFFFLYLKFVYPIVLEPKDDCPPAKIDSALSHYQ